MATTTIYASSVSGASWTNPNNAAGAPSSGNNAPYAEKVFPGIGSAVLTGTFDPVSIPGTITQVHCLFTARRVDLLTSITAVPALSGITVNETFTVPQTNFAAAALQADVSDPAALKASLASGLTGYTLTAASTTGDTIDVKGLGITITYNPDQVLQSSSRDRQRSRGRSC